MSIVEGYLDVMTISTEYLFVRLLKSNLIIDVVDIKVLNNIFLNQRPVEFRLIKTIQILTKVLQDISIGLTCGRHKE